MKKTLATAVLGIVLFAALAALTACAKTPPKNAVEAKPTPTAAPPAETRVPPPPAPPGGDVKPAPDSPSIAELNSKGYLKPAYFDYDKADLRDDARATLAADADWLKSQPGIQILIEGHCDERGTSAYNLALGDGRANAARDYLASLGIDATRMKTVSYGKERPACSESTEDCWQKNRRAAFVITAN